MARALVLMMTTMSITRTVNLRMIVSRRLRK